MITLKMWQAEVLKGEGAHFQENTGLLSFCAAHTLVVVGSNLVSFFF